MSCRTVGGIVWQETKGKPVTWENDEFVLKTIDVLYEKYSGAIDRIGVSDYCSKCGNEKAKCTCGNDSGW